MPEPRLDDYGGGGGGGDFIGGASQRRIRQGWGAYGRHRPGKPQFVSVGYRKGYENEPLNWGGESITNIQKALIASGYASSLRAGQWDKKSSGAFKKLLEDANRSGTTWEEQLTASLEAQARTEAGELGGGKEPKQGKVINKPNLVTGGGTFKTTAHEEMSVAMRNTFNDLLAMDPSAAEELLFIADQRSREIFEQAVPQQQEDAMKTAAFMQDMADVNAVQAGQGALEAGQDIVTGGQQANVPNRIVEGAPSAAAAAELIARTKYPARYGAVATNKRLSGIQEAMHAGTSGLARPLAR